jgi:hypothetical protein
MSANEHPLPRLGLRDLTVSCEMLINPVDFHAPSCIAYTNYPILEPIAGSSHLRNLYIEGHYEMDPIELGQLPTGTELIVLGDEQFIPMYNGLILADQVPKGWDNQVILNILDIQLPRVDVPGSAVLIARYGVRTWGHWLGELLPKMVCVEAAFPGKHRYILPASIFSQMELRSLLESIWYNGIDLARIVPVQPNTVYCFSSLLAVSPVWTNNKIHPGVVEQMRLRTHPFRGSMPKKVAFLRTESRTRNVANLAGIIDELRERDFAMVEIGGMSFADQTAIFSAADCVVSVLGSGLTGLIYSPFGLHVLTLAPAKWSDLFFFALMQNRNATLADIRGVQDPTDQRDPAKAQFVVELNELRRGLQALGLL